MTAPIKALCDLMADIGSPQMSRAGKARTFSQAETGTIPERENETAHSYEIARRQWTQTVTDLRLWDDDRDWPDAAQDYSKDAQKAKDNQEDLDVWPTQAST